MYKKIKEIIKGVTHEHFYYDTIKVFKYCIDNLSPIYVLSKVLYSFKKYYKEVLSKTKEGNFFMASGILDPNDNYSELYSILNEFYSEVEGKEFYQYIFPNNQKKGELSNDFSKPNAIYLYKDEELINKTRTLTRRIMLKDTWEEDYQEYVVDNPMTLCGGLAYRGLKNRLESAQQMNALVFDLDAVGINELKNLFIRIGKKPALRTLPQPTFIVMSGTGLHLYYVFEEPIDLYPNIKLQMKSLKYDLTFRIWDYKGTTQEKQIQYQSINQGFRMVGSKNDKYNLTVRAFKTGNKVSLEYLNSYTIEDKNKVDTSKPFRPTQYTRAEAKENFPSWYERVVIKGNKRKKQWEIKRDLYDWWIRQSEKVKGGHRYYFLMAMSIYAVKCNIPKDELKKDMYKVFEELKDINHNHPLEEKDIYSALETYDRQYYNFTINDIEKLTDIRIDRNKRNYRNQDLHLKGARSIQEINDPNAEWRNLKGRPSKEQIVKKYINENPEANPTEIASALGVSRSTVYKYMKK